MNNLLNQAKLLSDQRKKYHEEYDKRQRTQIKEKPLPINHYINPPLTKSDIIAYGEHLDTEYNNLPPEKKKFVFNDGIPTELLSFNWKTAFDLSIPTTTKYNDDSKDFNKNQSAGDNCKTAYEMCINEILKNHIEIYSIEKTLSSFYNRSTSCMCGNLDVFKFHCKKNDYVF